jgi:hypothetical protein
MGTKLSTPPKHSFYNLLTAATLTSGRQESECTLLLGTYLYLMTKKEF